MATVGRTAALTFPVLAHTVDGQVINFVPQQEAWVVERFGKFETILEPVSCRKPGNCCDPPLLPHSCLLSGLAPARIRVTTHSSPTPRPCAHRLPSTTTADAFARFSTLAG